MDDDIRRAKKELFLELKPYCVRLSQLALKSDGGTSNDKELRDTTAQLLGTLRGKCRANTLFDDNLANYVFFPLSQVLKLCQKRTGRLAELATKCLQELLEYGWRTLAPDLGQQLLLLLTYFAGGGPPSVQVSEELQKDAYGALGSLFKILHNSPKGGASLVEASAIPTFGQCLTTILDGIMIGSSVETQLEALHTLKCLWSCIKEKQILMNFLPGTVSALTKCLTPTTKTPRSRKVLISALEGFQKIIATSLGDVVTRNLQSIERKTGEDKPDDKRIMTESWLNATSKQIKLALANVTKLRNHEHPEVRKALAEMCVVILGECQTSLAESFPMLVETALIITSSGVEEDTLPKELSLMNLAVMYPSISELIKGAMYNWVTSLPRVMQGSDEPAKQSALKHISRAQIIFSDLELDSAVLNDALALSLRNSVVSLLELTTSPKAVRKISSDALNISGSLVWNQTVPPKQYRPVVMPHGSQTATREQLDLLIANIGPPGVEITMARDLLKYMQNSSGNNMLSAFWLSFKLLQTAMSSFLDVDVRKDRTISLRRDREAIMLELYTFAVSNLSDLDDDDVDWRIQATSLEVVAYTASIWGVGFRPDLVDTLYPIVHFLGSHNVDLRTHAITSLNLISASCRYSNAGEMITSNVDYLVNAISLKLNTFDISPRAPQALTMMIQLSGASLLPYLDDIVGSIFAALDNFHGYPKLVDSLFNVLGKIVEESGNSGQLKIHSSSSLNHRKEKPIGINIEEILNILNSRIKRASVNDGQAHGDFPTAPWKDAKSQLDEMEAFQDIEEKTSEDVKLGQIQKLPPTKVYTMVQNIARLGQHYLTNQSPSLRAKLLDLIHTANEALCEEEDQYLPLVNDIWPVLIKRLYDEESFVVIAACRAIAGTCQCAGDFMSTRIQVEWLSIMNHARQAKKTAKAEKTGRYARGVYSQKWQVWEAFTSLIIVIIEYVRVDDDMFDEALELLAELLGTREDVRSAFSAVNEDAVWLQELHHGRLPPVKTPAMTGIRFIDIDEEVYEMD